MSKSPASGKRTVTATAAVASPDNINDSPTAFGCIPMRSAVSSALGVQIGYSIGAVFLPNLVLDPNPLTIALLVQYMVAAIWILVLVFLAYVLLSRKLPTYRTLAKLNVFLWAANLVAAGAKVAAGSYSHWSVVVIQAAFVGVSFTLLGYAAWAVYKYAGIMEEEEAKMESKHEGAV